MAGVRDGYCPRRGEYYAWRAHGGILARGGVNTLRGGRTGALLPATGVNALRGGRAGALLPAAPVNALRGGRTGRLLPATLAVFSEREEFRHQSGGEVTIAGELAVGCVVSVFQEGSKLLFLIEG